MLKDYKGNIINNGDWIIWHDDNETKDRVVEVEIKGRPNKSLLWNENYGDYFEYELKDSIRFHKIIEQEEI